MRRKKGLILSFIDETCHLIIPENYRRSSYQWQKAKLLTIAHGLIILIGFLVAIQSLLGTSENDISGFLLVLWAVVLMVVFRLRKSLFLSGNLIALSVFMCLAPVIFTSGGLNSDNLVWMVLAPILAFLFANRWSGLIWLFILVIFTSYVYSVEINSAESFLPQLQSYSPAYFLTSWVLFFSMISLVVYFFSKGESDYVEELLEKETLLTQQRDAFQNQTRKLSESESQLKKSNENLEQFAYSASHDLKEPLRMIRSFSQILQRSLSDELEGKNKECLHYIIDGVGRMDKMLDDLLGFARLNGNNEDNKEVDLQDVLLEVYYNLMVSIQKNHVVFSQKGSLPVIFGKQTLMVQLLQNIISNGIKFRKPDRNPEVEIFAEENHDAYTIIITDNGIGISKENQSKIFEVFTRLHSREEFEGTGIGLATCKKIVESLGGEIWISSEVGKGTSFFFTIPKIKPATEAAAEQNESKTTLTEVF